MRILLSGLVAAGLLSSHVAAAQTCARPADREAFEVTGLKSQLMVTALTCNANEKYNTFVRTHQSYLVNQDKALSAYFTRAHGRQARKQHDDYITQLANSQSQNGLKRGTLFCAENASIFDEVQALKGDAELSDFAAGKALSQPVSLTACTTPEAPVRAAAQTSTRSTSRRR